MIPAGRRQSFDVAFAFVEVTVQSISPAGRIGDLEVGGAEIAGWPGEIPRVPLRLDLPWLLVEPPDAFQKLLQKGDRGPVVDYLEEAPLRRRAFELLHDVLPPRAPAARQVDDRDL